MTNSSFPTAPPRVRFKRVRPPALLSPPSCLSTVRPLPVSPTATYLKHYLRHAQPPAPAPASASAPAPIDVKNEPLLSHLPRTGPPPRPLPPAATLPPDPPTPPPSSPSSTHVDPASPPPPTRPHHPWDLTATQLDHVLRHVNPPPHPPDAVVDALWRREVDAAMQRAVARKLVLRQHLKDEARHNPPKGVSRAKLVSRREAKVTWEFRLMQIDELREHVKTLVRRNALLAAASLRLSETISDGDGQGEKGGKG